MKRTPYNLSPSLDKSIRILFLFVFFAGLCLNSFSTPQTASAVSTGLVISQVYGGGGNSGATYQNDFIELFNRGNSTVSLTGYSVQYGSASTGSGSSFALSSGSIASGKYYLIQGASSGAVGTTNPTPDAISTLNLSGMNGSVRLLSNASTVDLIGYGTGTYVNAGAAGSETAPAPVLSNTTAAFRGNGGCTDTDNNSIDFTAATPSPRNSSTTANPCNLPSNPTGTGSASPTVVQPGSQVTLTVNVTPGANPASTGLAVSADLTPIGGSATQAFSANGNVFTYTATIPGDASDAPITINFTVSDNEHPSTSGTINFTISAAGICGGAYTHTYEVQGNGSISPMVGSTVTVQGVVIADFEGNSGLKGFYIQDQTGDSDDTTSDGLFIYDQGQDYVNSVGQVVRVTGAVSENFNVTELTVAINGFVDCGTTATITPTDVTLPFTSATFPERYEDMLVRMPQNLYVSESYQLGRFNQVTMSSGDRLRQPTQLADPGTDAQAIQAANDLNQVVVDDGSLTQDLDPITFSRGTYPTNQLTASNTLRIGDRSQNITGVMTWEWGGASASPNAWRVRVTVNPTFTADNPRPASPEDVGGTIRVAGMNLLNFFNTFGSTACTFGVGGASTDCRGADNQTEFDRQVAKTLAAIEATQADVIAFSEIENDGYGPSSAIADLVNRLNAATAPNTYAFIDADAATSQTNALGTDAIKVGILYKPAKVTPVGNTAVLNTGAFGQFTTTSGTTGRSRPPLAQTFAQVNNNAVFTVVANHLKSKGSACDDNISPVGPDPDTGDGQGNCNLTRKAAAEEESAWLASSPTGISDPDVLILGDMNSYAKEDPIKAFESGSYQNLISELIGPNAYSYVFDGQSGYLDHALASGHLAGQVTGVTEFHNNSDEPTVLDYNTEFKSAGQVTSLYNADEYRASDHDPVLVGLNLTCDPLALLVTSESDDGSDNCGTLTGAINQAASTADTQANTITLAASTITLNGNLQHISAPHPDKPLTIGPISSCDTLASTPGGRIHILAGSGAGATGLTLGSNVILQGVSITGFSASGITVIGAHTVIACSRIGTADGSTAAANGTGIDLQPGSSDNSLGKVNEPNSGNLISGNSGKGIYVEVDSSDNKAYYNLVGYGSSGTTVLKNGDTAVKIDQGGKLSFGPGNRIHG